MNNRVKTHATGRSFFSVLKRLKKSEKNHGAFLNPQLNDNNFFVEKKINSITISSKIHKQPIGSVWGMHEPIQKMAHTKRIFYCNKYKHRNFDNDFSKSLKFEKNTQFIENTNKMNSITYNAFPSVPVRPGHVSQLSHSPEVRTKRIFNRESISIETKNKKNDYEKKKRNIAANKLGRRSGHFVFTFYSQV